ncbi:hypothetical protein [Natrarchaeobius chitinivorans]|uniref:Uncharacterized protein n=1 Tax=Natrarchaeobius chitinivorans TaxID=1679083 RepID=A0A3N6MPU7_NATCH|nr:hypothetical protein [Natrarchaeobius chitinivorans]RQG96566.1 hypothetical protein EA473_05500 [Natrarchaeobius chitinivorans]
MKVPALSRRAVIATGGLAAGAGIVGGAWFGRDRTDDGPGARSFSAGTVPGGIDRLVHARVGELADDDTAREATTTILESAAFADVPESLSAIVGGETETDVDPSGLRKLVLCGNDADGSVAIVWTTWGEADLLEELETVAGVTAESNDDEAVTYSLGESTVASLTDDAFVIGAEAMSRAVVDVWHADADPLTGDLLRTFEGATTDAPVRFAFATPGSDCPGPLVPDDDIAEAVEYAFGSAHSADGERIVDANLWTNSLDAARDVHDEIGATLDRDGQNDADDPFDPPEVREYVALERDNQVVTLEFRSETAASLALVRSFLRTVGCPVRS